jgi:hypothetical protein
VLLLSIFTAIAATGWGAEMKVPITITGGHETDPQDRGRPVVLVAAALGVKTEVFREAFRGVTPARGGRPSPEQARANKEALMRVLKPHGITNDRLDEVSNYYRYQPQRGELWKTTPASAYALVENGQIKRIVVTTPGSGYSSSPKLTLQGMANVPLKATLHFEKDLQKNGSISKIDVAGGEPKAKA